MVGTPVETGHPEVADGLRIPLSRMASEAEAETCRELNVWTGTRESQAGSPSAQGYPPDD
jgi:hypothetical protein